MGAFVKLSYFVASAEEDLQGKTEEEIEMMKTMGFASFDTTKVSADQRGGVGGCLSRARWCCHAHLGDNTLSLGTFFFLLLVFQGKKVDGAANAYAINVSQKRKYRFVPCLFF